MESWHLYIIAGIVTGVWSALFGVGGGFIIVPILTMIFGFGQKSAQGISLLVILPTALAGFIRYKLNSEISINLPVAGWMAVGGILGAMIGSYFVFNLSETLLKRMFAVFLISVGVSMFIKSFTKPAKAEVSQETAIRNESTHERIAKQD